MRGISIVSAALAIFGISCSNPTENETGLAPGADALRQAQLSVAGESDQQGESADQLSREVDQAVDEDGEEVGVDPNADVLTDSQQPQRPPEAVPAARIGKILVSGKSWAKGREYLIPRGSDAQFASVPFKDVSIIKLVFSKNVSISPADIAVRGVKVSNYKFDLTYDNVERAAFISLHSVVANDIIRLIVMSDGVKDADGLALDGEWEDGVTAAYSGNGVAGGDLRFRFQVLKGDVTNDKKVFSNDVITVRDKPSSGPDGYVRLYDIDSDGDVDYDDMMTVAHSQFVFPPAEPVLSPGGKYELNTLSDITNRCASDAKQPVGQFISFRDNAKKCPWNQLDNGSPRDGLITARVEYNEALAIPKNAYICDLALSFKPGMIRYDDEIAFRLNDVILASSIDMGTRMGMKSDEELVFFDWRNILNRLRPGSAEPYCLGAGCVIPDSETYGQTRINVPATSVRKISAVAYQALQPLKLNFTIFGDGNSGTDCRFNDITVGVKGSYIVP